MKLTKEYLATLPADKRQQKILKEYIKCKNDFKYCIETYFTVLAGTKRTPFKLFPHQEEILYAYQNFINCISLKTRQMGFTTFTSAYVACLSIFENNHKTLLISKTLDDSKDFLKLIKDILNEAREDYPWLVPEYQKGYDNKISFTLATGSLVKASSTSDTAGRGIPGLKLAIVDEAAYIDRKSPGKMQEIWSALSPALAAVQGRTIIISTPKGVSGWYFNTYTNAKTLGFHIIEAHWTKHPIYSKGTYQWIANENDLENGGHLKWYNENWPDSIFDKDTGNFIKMIKESYQFIKDGKIRSPWYDLESKKLGNLLTRCELDCSFSGTGGEVIDSDLLREIRTYADTCTYTNPYEKLGGIYRNYKQYKEFNSAHQYVLSGDVATGDGDDYSTFTVLDLTELEICATYKEQLLPETFALIIKQIASDYGKCKVVVENAGGGGTTLQELKRQSYSNIYYSILQKKDPSTGMKKKKIGLWMSEDVRWQGGDRLEGVIRLREIKIPCLDIYEELQTWIWDKDGKRRHAPEKNDDLIIALQHGVWYYFYAYQRSQRNKEIFRNSFEVQRGTIAITLSESDYAKGSLIVDRHKYHHAARNPYSGNLDNMVDKKLLSIEEQKEFDERSMKVRKFFM